MRLQLQFLRHNIALSPSPSSVPATFFTSTPPISYSWQLRVRTPKLTLPPLESRRPKLVVSATAVPDNRPLDLTEDNVRQALGDARAELAQIFDASVGITGVVELAELDGPFVKISLKGRFWHKRSTVVARVGNYLKQRIPEILEVEIEDESQLDDSPASF
ncbi:hypothetical protein SDJN02_19352 [Cucurbita argyrosperma subsp. argyrosperma]